MSFINDERIKTFNDAYFLTYTYSLEPIYLRYTYKKFNIDVYNKNPLDILYLALFSERLNNFYFIKLNNIVHLEEYSTLEFNYYFKKNIKEFDYDYYIELFIENLNLYFERYNEKYLKQYKISTITLKEINKDTIKNNEGRLNGRLSKSYYINDNSFEFLINNILIDISEVNHTSYVIHTEFTSILIYYIESDNNEFLITLNDIIDKTFLNSYNLLYYEPLLSIPILPQFNEEESELDLIILYQLLKMNNINFKIKTIRNNNKFLIYIEKISSSKIKIKNFISELILDLNNIRDIPFGFIYPRYIKELYLELFRVFYKYNSETIEKYFYISNELRKDVEYIQYDLKKTEKRIIHYIPIIYLDNLGNLGKTEWNELNRKWLSFLKDYHQYRIFNISKVSLNQLNKLNLYYSLYFDYEKENEFISLYVLNKRTNELVFLKKIPNNKDKIAKYIKLWKDKKLLPDISYKFYLELLEIPKSTMRLEN